MPRKVRMVRLGMKLHNENQRCKNLDLRGFSSLNVLFTRLTLTDLGGDMGISILRCSGVAIFLFFIYFFFFGASCSESRAIMN